MNDLLQTIERYRALGIEEQMKSSEIQALFSQFEAAAGNVEGIECWSARELCSLLGYTQWRNFVNAIDTAREACRNAQQKESDHFADTSISPI